jgi:UDP-N-acetylglucosamine--N-acetylmuramyl-(pentapeptide) pyrophosphoryl-undecaprenol N-acetylglucosamine transferase
MTAPARDASRPLHVVLAGGGTAGHIEPALALADALLRRDARTGITVLGTETRLVPERGYELTLIPPVPIPRKLSGALLTAPARLRAAVKVVEGILRRTKADVVVGFGGYVAAPAYLAARRMHVPFVVHEANARPGLANRLGARSTPYVATATPGSLPHSDYVGIPIRRAVATLDRAATRTEARAFFGLEPDRPTLLVFGGSQGARRINDAVAAAAADLATAGIQVLHVAGPKGDVDVKQAAPGEPPYVVVGYCDRMDLAYAAADLALCRAGAMTCAELAAVGLPAVYVPLPIGNGEQRLNAQPVVEAGGGLLLADEDCTTAWVAATLAPLLADAPRVERMGQAAAAFGRRDADERLVDLVLRAADGVAP